MHIWQLVKFKTCTLYYSKITQQQPVLKGTWGNINAALYTARLSCDATTAASLTDSCCQSQLGLIFWLSKNLVVLGRELSRLLQVALFSEWMLLACTPDLATSSFKTFRTCSNAEMTVKFACQICQYFTTTVLARNHPAP